MSNEATMHKSQLQRLMERAAALPAAALKVSNVAPPATPDPDADPYEQADYEWGPGQAFIAVRGTRKQPGFLILDPVDGSYNWVYYHSILNMRGLRKNGYDYLQFSSDGRAVTIQGKRLQILATMIGEGRLKCLFMPAAGMVHGVEDGVLISAVLVTDTTTPKEEGEGGKGKPVLVTDNAKKAG